MKNKSPFDRKKLTRERLEIYLVNLLMMYRRIFFFVGLFVMLIASLFLNFLQIIGLILFLVAVYLIMMNFSYSLVVFTARIITWINLVARKNDG